MTPVALRAIGMIDASGDWTGKYGVHSRADFLADPEAQENAVGDYLQDTERQLKANGSFDFAGTSISGLVSRFTVTCAGLIAAGHREGPTATRRYLAIIESNGSRVMGLTRQQRAIETRLRTFSDAVYE